MMRTVLSIALVFAFTACGDDAQVGADALWQVRCPQGVAGCSASGTEVSVLDFDGANGIRVDCSLEPLAGGVNNLLNIEIVANSQQRLTISNLTVAASGAIAGTGTVTIRDGDQDLVGDVRGTAPTADVPCQIMPIQFVDRVEGPAMTVELLCREISNPAAPMFTQRDLVFPNDRTRPALINVFNCAGL